MGLQIWSRPYIRNSLHAIQLTLKIANIQTKRQPATPDFLNGFERALQIAAESFGLMLDPETKTFQLQQEPTDPFMPIWLREDVRQKLQMLNAAVHIFEYHNVTPDYIHGFQAALDIVGQAFGLNDPNEPEYHEQPLAE
jgi:hypothetical protein